MRCGGKHDDDVSAPRSAAQVNAGTNRERGERSEQSLLRAAGGARQGALRGAEEVAAERLAVRLNVAAEEVVHHQGAVPASPRTVRRRRERQR